MPIKCIACNQALGPKSPGLECGFCASSYHVRCVELTKSQLELIKASEFIIWKCPACLESADEKNKQATCSGCAATPVLLESIRKLSETVDDLKSQINKSLNTDNGNNVENIINEITDREKRSKNIIIFKLKESEETNLHNKKRDDTKQAKNIIKHISNEINIGNIETFRLGKSNNSPRPLKVTLNSKEDARKLVWNKSKLRDAQFRLVIGFDETVMQRKHYKKVKEEMEERKKQGERLILKYTNGTPTIVKAKD